MLIACHSIVWVVGGAITTLCAGIKDKTSPFSPGLLESFVLCQLAAIHAGSDIRLIAILMRVWNTLTTVDNHALLIALLFLDHIVDLVC